MARRLRFFGHIVRSDSDEDHTRALNAGIDDPKTGDDLAVVFDKRGCVRPETAEPGSVVCPAQSI